MIRLLLLVALFFSASVQAAIPAGLGASTYRCIDVDGDGYGVGPGCAGPDADDNDVSINTGAAAIAAHGGTLKTFLQYRGYNPSRIWYLAPSTATPAGNDSTGVVDDVSHPYLTYAAIRLLVQPGDAVIMRDAWSGTLEPPNGTASAPVLFMSYPGELAVISDPTGTNGTRIRVSERSYLIFDGLKTVGAANIGDGGTLDGRTSSTFHDNVFRHMETIGSGPQGLGGIAAFNGLVNITIEYNVFHDLGSGGQHCLYLGSRGLVSDTLTIRRNICFGANYNGFHLNGRMYNMRVEQNIIYNVTIAGISLQEGVSNSTFSNNLVFNYAHTGIEISNYPGNCSQFGQGGTGDICPYDQINNLFQNNTLYSVATEWDSGQTLSPMPVQVLNYSVNRVGDLGHNTWLGNIFVGLSQHYPPVVYREDTGQTDFSASGYYLSTTTFTNNVFYALDGSTATIGWGLYPGSYGYNPYNCTQAATITIMAGCVDGDPKLTNVSQSYWNSPTSFDFRLLAGSPAIAETSTGSSLDIIGNSRPTQRSAGAYEYSPTGATDTTPPTVAFIAPTNGQTVGCDCQFTTSASDDSGAAGITQTLKIDGKVYATATGATLSHHRRLRSGSHTVSVTATDAAGNSATTTITITVQ